MSNKLEILSQVMLSLKSKQAGIMHNINALLSNASNEVDLMDKIEFELGKLSDIHAKMQECEFFMLQLAESMMPPKPESQEENNEEK
jgi:hypothetical protein